MLDFDMPKLKFSIWRRSQRPIFFILSDEKLGPDQDGARRCHPSHLKKTKTKTNTGGNMFGSGMVKLKFSIQGKSLETSSMSPQVNRIAY